MELYGGLHYSPKMQPHLYIYILLIFNPSAWNIDIAPKVRIFPEAEGRGKYLLQRVQYVLICHKEELNITQAKFISQLC